MTEFVQGGMFGGLTFKPLDFAGEFGPKPAAKNPFDDAFDQFNSAKTAIGKVSAGSGITGSTIKGASDAGVVANAGGGILGSSGTGLGNVLIRGVVVVLGFIFVAVGLTMFKGGAVIVAQKAAGIR